MLKKLKQYLFDYLTIKKRIELDNIYYCCTQKTASQWFRKVFSEPIFYKNTGLKIIPYQQINNSLQDAKFDKPFPKKSLISHLYIDYRAYQTIPKPEKYKTFFILRDPRDILVSWYFSVKNSHPENPLILQSRNDLSKLSITEGLKYGIGKLVKRGLFDAQKSWIEQNDERVKIFRYEDFISNNYNFLTQLFKYIEIEMSQVEMMELVETNQFQKYSGNRDRGIENQNSHYRKGISGDWINYFDDSITDYFKTMTGDLLKITGYSE